MAEGAQIETRPKRVDHGVSICFVSAFSPPLINLVFRSTSTSFLLFPATPLPPYFLTDPTADRQQERAKNFEKYRREGRSRIERGWK